MKECLHLHPVTKEAAEALAKKECPYEYLGDCGLEAKIKRPTLKEIWASFRVNYRNARARMNGRRPVLLSNDERKVPF